LQNFALAVRRLRENIESELTINATDLGRQAGDELTDADYRTIGDSTLEGIIMQTKMKIDAAADETEKFKAVFN